MIDQRKYIIEEDPTPPWLNVVSAKLVEMVKTKKNTLIILQNIIHGYKRSILFLFQLSKFQFRKWKENFLFLLFNINEFRPVAKW